MDFIKIGVIGSGQMGSGIAQVFASYGFSVILYDIEQTALNKAVQNIKISLHKLFEKGHLPEHPPTVLARFATTTDLQSLFDREFIIEAIPENENLKKNIFQKLDEFVNENCVFASNTSSLSITKLSSHLKRKDKFIGMHFMNPVPIMNLVEVIQGHHTSKETLQLTKNLIEILKKQYVIAQDYPGFIINRILMPMINEAFYAVMEGIATPKDVDIGMKIGTNQPMGPLTLADFIGLDTCYAIMKVLYDGLGDSKYRPCPLLKKYVDAGDFGKKTGRGVFSYEK